MELSQAAVFHTEPAALARHWILRLLISCLAAALCPILITAPAFGDDQAQSSPSPRAATATIHGTVTDPSGLVVASAIVTLETPASANPRTTITDEAGSFHFSGVEPGSCKVTVTALGFTVWTTNVVIASGESPAPLSAVLQVAPASTKVDVGLTQHELAVQQVKAEEKQRLLGIFPDYFVSYEPNPAPLTAAQKFELGWKSFIDPVPVVGAAIAAGIQQARNSYHEYGQGMEGYGKRFGAQYGDGVNGILIGHVLMQSVFHQDPRYFYKGTGSVRRRFLYAIATAFVCKGDNGHWQPDYSDVLGGLAAGEISTLYYPASSRTGLRLFHNVLLGFAGRAAGNLAQEFVLRKVTTHVPKMAARWMQPTLHEGTPVPLISVQDLSSKLAANTGPIDFVLTHDIQVEGAIVAKAGSKASGEVTYSAEPAGNGQPMHVSLANVRLKLGNTEIPLRSTPQKRDGDALEYHRLEDSGRIAITLYVAQNVTLPRAQ
jgi:hypothetical protein